MRSETWSRRGVGAGLVLLLGGAAGCGEEAGIDCVDAPGAVCVWAGKTGELGFDGDGKHRRDSMLYWPKDLEFAADGTAYVLDWNNHAVRQVRRDGTFQTVVGNGFVGDGPVDQSDLTLPGAPGTEVALNHPTDIGFLPDGTILLMSWHNHKLRALDPASGLVWVMCGRGAGYRGDGGPAVNALFNQPDSLVVAPDGAIYIADQRNFRIRKISAGTAPVVSTVVGSGTAGFSGDGGPPLAAQLRFEAGGNPEPSGAVTLDADGRLYIADSLNHRIRRVDFTADRIETVAGTGEAGAAGDGGPAVAAQLNNPRDIEIGPDGALYIADTENHRIRVVDLAAGTIQTYTGSGVAGSAVGSSRQELELSRPFGIAFDPEGMLYVADTFNSRILRVNP
jgi:sugar lactone lactonase YvrE